MKILELFDNQQENFGTDFMTSFKQAAAGGGGGEEKGTTVSSAKSSGPFASTNPKLLKQALANVINGQPLDSAQLQIFKKAYNQL